jgi:hypothetical protein
VSHGNRALSNGTLDCPRKVFAWLPDNQQSCDPPIHYGVTDALHRFGGDQATEDADSPALRRGRARRPGREPSAINRKRLCWCPTTGSFTLQTDHRQLMRKPATFRQTDVTKAVKAVAAVGVGVARVDIEPSGKIVITIGSGEPIEPATPLDKWMAGHARAS